MNKRQKKKMYDYEEIFANGGYRADRIDRRKLNEFLRKQFEDEHPKLRLRTILKLKGIKL